MRRREVPGMAHMNAVHAKSLCSLILALMLVGVCGRVMPADVNPELQARLDSLPLPENIEGKPARFASVRKLLDISSGARQVRASDNP